MTVHIELKRRGGPDPFQDALVTHWQQMFLDEFFSHTDDGCPACRAIEEGNRLIERKRGDERQGER